MSHSKGRCREDLIRHSDEARMSMKKQRAHPQARETTMNWNWFRLDWVHFKDEVRDNWRKLTDEDLTRIAGRRTELIGRLQVRYGFAKAEAEREAEAWMRAQAARRQRRGGPAAWRGASHRFGASYSW
jgi:uncharacterized protein YjbJ (UPF0337 family)